MAARGIALGQELGLGAEDRDALVLLAGDRGYASAWTNARGTRDPFDACARWTHDGLTAGISVVPLDAWDPAELARVASETAGRARGFVLGVGSGQTTRGALALVRERVALMRRAAPGVPVYVGALGPRMLRLAGEVADGAALNWCDPERVAWSREQVDAGARAVGRDPREVRLIEYIRVCVADDTGAARTALATAMLGYALAGPHRPKDSGYRSHFTRMGFDEVLTGLEARRDRGEAVAALAADVPAELVAKVGAFGPPAASARTFASLSAGLDLPIVRVVPAGEVVRSARAAIEALAPR